MSRAKLSFVMFSALLSHGGGRETWLNNVLPRLLAAENAPDIDVYYIADADTDRHPKIPVRQDPRVRFEEVRLPRSGSKWVSALRIVLFCWRVTTRLMRQPRAQHHVVAVGSFYEGAVLALLRLCTIRRPVLVAWIRGVWSKEINHRHGRLLKRFICAMEARFLACADKVISNGNDTKLHYEQLLCRPVEAIPNAIDVARYSSVSTEAFGGGRRTISFVGRLSEEKGFRAYLNAIDRYLATYRDERVVFDIVGDGPLSAAAEATAGRYPTAVRYVGPVSNDRMLTYLQTIDAGTCLTYSKDSGGGGVSNGLLELVGARRLVIAWDSPIFRQVLDDTQALFVPEGDIDALCLAFRRTAEDPAPLKNKILNGSACLHRYSLEQHVEHFLRYIHA